LPGDAEAAYKAEEIVPTHETSDLVVEGLFVLSDAEQEWIEKYRQALLASSRTKESRFGSIVKGIAEAAVLRLRKFLGREPAIQMPQPRTTIHSAKNPSSQRQRKKKRAS
jgi:hypothetical protein